jgi:hypothetical protein
MEFNHYTKEGKNKIYINDTSKVFTQYIDEREGKLSLKVFLSSKSFGEKYTREEFSQCTERRSELVESLNKASIGVTFDASTGGETV